MPTQVPTTPLRRALGTTIRVAIFAVVVRYTWGAFDPHMRSWSLLGVAPVLGVLTYLQASAREAAVASFFIILGSLGLAFWISLLASGLYPVARADIPWLIIILAIPVVCLGIGLQKRHQLRRGPDWATRPPID